MRLACTATIALALLAAPGAVRADESTATPPCDGCVFVPPDSDGRPLIVLLHGDDQPASELADAFRATARERDLALFAPQCPSKLGCDRYSLWRWNGEARWLARLVDDLVYEHDLDPERVWLVGWSGGAAYGGLQLAALAPRYAAVAFVGGGSPGGSCARTGRAARALPVLMISGDRNPHHEIMEVTHQFYVGCRYRVAWRVLRDKDHDDEWRMLKGAAMQRELLDFLEQHER